jgi:hypothetical protein
MSPFGQLSGPKEMPYGPAFTDPSGNLLEVYPRPSYSGRMFWLTLNTFSGS